MNSAARSAGWPDSIILVRHGESARNVAKTSTMVFYDIKERAGDALGIPDHKIPLTPSGILQARAAGKAIAKAYPQLDATFDSGYVRTADTRRYILEAYPEEVRERIRIIQDVMLRERTSGWAYDMLKTEVDAAFPWLEEYWKTFGPFFGCPPGGESLAESVDRANIFLIKLRFDYAGKKVLVASHGRKILCMRFLLEGWTWEQGEKFAMNHNPERPKNCGVTEYEYSQKENRMILKEYNTVYE